VARAGHLHHFANVGAGALGVIVSGIAISIYPNLGTGKAGAAATGFVAGADVDGVKSFITVIGTPNTLGQVEAYSVAQNCTLGGGDRVATYNLGRSSHR